MYSIVFCVEKDKKMVNTFFCVKLTLCFCVLHGDGSFYGQDLYCTYYEKKIDAFMHLEFEF